MTLRMHKGATFTPRVVPGGNAPEFFLAARFKGSEQTNTWPCIGKVILGLPAHTLEPFAGDGTVEDLGTDRCGYEVGSWSWVSLAALLGRFGGANIEVVHPPELLDAFADLAARYTAAAGGTAVGR